MQIAKTTMLLALGKEVKDLRSPVRINIILANTLLAPVEREGKMFGSEFQVQIDKKKFLINTQILHDNELFDMAIDLCDTLAESTQHKKADDEIVFGNLLRKKYTNGGFNGNVTSGFYKIYEALKDVKERGRNSIWKFILQNLYKPYFLNNKFDFVIGNPPWFTYSSVRNEEYQKVLLSIAVAYNVKPERSANMPHLEIAAIFMSYCSDYFLNSGGKLAFVLPRSFYNADHHSNTRNGSAKGFRITKTWDLDNVNPLFRVPSCVLFASKNNNNTKAPNEFDAVVFKGRLPLHNCFWDFAKNYLHETNTKIYFARQGKSSALSYSDNIKQQKTNPYKKLFKQGATIVPRAFYFIEMNQNYPKDWISRILEIKTSKEIENDAKKPWKGIELLSKMESEFIYRTAISKNILPFNLYNPLLVTLPLLIEIDDNEQKLIKFHDSVTIKKEGYLYSSIWFQNCENIWNQLKTQKSKNMSSYDRLNFQRGIVSQNLNFQYLVLYNSSAKNANATVLNRKELDLEFIVESKTYYYGTNNDNEAFYLVSILNSTIPNKLMKDFQSRGLFGARDVHKKILDIYFPRFNKNEKLHIQLAKAGKNAEHKTKEFLKKNPPTQPLTANKLGRLRLEIKNELKAELKEIDDLVKELLK